MDADKVYMGRTIRSIHIDDYAKQNRLTGSKLFRSAMPLDRSSLPFPERCSYTDTVRIASMIQTVASLPNHSSLEHSVLGRDVCGPNR